MEVCEFIRQIYYQPILFTDITSKDTVAQRIMQKGTFYTAVSAQKSGIERLA